MNYDLLVSNIYKEIKSLISFWLGIGRKISITKSKSSLSFNSKSVQVLSPINSKSIGGWKKYKDMLKPAIEILTQTDKY